MNNYLKIIAGVVLVVAVVGAYFFPKSQVIVKAGSPQGSTISTPNFAGAVINLASPGSNATSTSILNNSSSDRIITGIRLGCEGVGTSQTAYTGAGLAQWLFSVGTSSIALPAGSSTAALLGAWTNVVNNYNVPTSTVNYAMASSTSQLATSTLAALWPAGSYLDFIFNATNTAACHVGADYVTL